MWPAALDWTYIAWGTVAFGQLVCSLAGTWSRLPVSGGLGGMT